MAILRIGKNCGFCFGVERAFKIALYEKNAYVLGDLVHNKNVIKKLEEYNIKTVKNLDEIPNCSKVIIRAHGIPKSVYFDLERKKCLIIDATCPFVKKIHNVVSLENKLGRCVIIAGDALHAEVIGIKSRVENSLVLSENELLNDFSNHSIFCDYNRDLPITLVFQTTFKKSSYEKIVKKMKLKFSNIKIFDTICFSTKIRQEETKEIAAWADIMFVFGDNNSSNTNKLVEIATEFCYQTYILDNSKKIEKYYEKLTDTTKIGIVAGASVPVGLIKETRKMLLNNENISINDFEGTIENNFDNMGDALEIFENTITENDINVNKSYEKGSVVKGIISAITSNEIKISINPNLNGILNNIECIDDFSKFQIGNEIKAFVQSFMPKEKKLKLTLKENVENSEDYNEILNAYQNNTVLSGRVCEVVNGGMIIIFKSMKVFIPASQVSDIYVKDLGIYLNEELKFKIIDIIEQRNIKKIVGSVRLVIIDEKREQKKEFWKTAKVSNTYSGVVKSITNFGVFVDIGGIDGLLHNGEILFWKKQHPNQNLIENTRVEVYIKYLDKEKEKISLGYRKDENVAINNINSGDKIEGIVTGITDFGIFVDIGCADGLLHSSELSWDKRIKDPSTLFKIGDKINVYVKSIDRQEGKISLGYRKEKDNPWNKFEENFKVDDILDCKVVRILPFGLFLEIIPKVEGLVHITEVSNRKITKPSEIVSIYDIVKAKIISIDNVNHHISMSMKGLNDFDSENFGGYANTRKTYEVEEKNN